MSHFLFSRNLETDSHILLLRQASAVGLQVTCPPWPGSCLTSALSFALAHIHRCFFYPHSNPLPAMASDLLFNSQISVLLLIPSPVLALCPKFKWDPQHLFPSASWLHTAQVPSQCRLTHVSLVLAGGKRGPLTGWRPRWLTPRPHGWGHLGHSVNSVADLSHFCVFILFW